MTDLLNIDENDISYFSFNNEEKQAKCIKVYDGDTITVVFDTFGTLCKHRIRLYGIDTPEIRTKDLVEKEKGFEARDFLRSIILNKIITIKCGEFDKYGRLLGTVIHDGSNINELLIEKKYAYAYFGGTKK